MDIQKIAETYGLDLKEAADIVRLFIKTAENDINAIQLAADSEDIENICQATHSLKGSSGNLGLMEMSETAVALEQAARKNRFAEVSVGLDGLSRQLAQIKSQMSDIG